MQTMASSLARGAGLVGLSGVLWGTVGIASKFLFGIADIAPLTVGFYRLAFAAPLLLLLAWALPGICWQPVDRRSTLLFIGLGLTQAGYQGLYFVGVAQLGVTQATLIALCSAPVLITVLAALFLRERAGLLAWLAVPTAVIGTLLLIGGPGAAVSGEASNPWGYAAAVGAALSYAVFALISRSLASHYHPFQIVALGFGVGAVTLFPIALVQGLALDMEPAAWGWVAYMAVVPTAIAYAVFLLGMRRVTATASGVLVLTEPLTAAILARLLFGETLGSWGLLGGALLLGAVLLASLPRRRIEK